MLTVIGMAHININGEILFNEKNIVFFRSEEVILMDLNHFNHSNYFT